MNVVKAKAVAVAAVSIGLLLASAGGASAAESRPSTTSTGQSCWVLLQPDGAESKTPTDPFCVDGDNEALLKALEEEKNIIVAEPTAAGRAEVRAAQQDAALSGAITPMATYVLGRVYIGTSYSGSSYNFTTTVGTGCSSHAFSIDDLRNYNWPWSTATLNNSIQSVQSAAPCKTWLYNDYNTVGSVYQVTGDASSLSWMAGLASSIRYTG